jgi:hypothetical protein
MTVLVVMAGLALDVGASYAKHTRLQNGADAAALALAQEYAVEGCAADDLMATSWVRQNVDVDDPTVAGDATCLGANRIRVESSATQDHWFLPVIGRESSDIGASATVAWGVPVAGGSSLPLAISQCSFTKRVDRKDVPLDGKITIWMDHPSDPFGDQCNEAYPPGGFGWLQPTNGKCASTVVLGPGGTYGLAPSKTGTPQPDECVSDNSFKRAVDSSDPVLVPIFEVAAGSGNGAQYRISRFAAFKLTGYDIHNKLGQYRDSCGPKPSSELKNCLVGEFVEYVTLESGMDLIPPTSADQTIVITLID